MSTITEAAHMVPSIAVQVDEMPRRRRFMPEEYLRMAEVGILKPGERTELIRGEITRMLPIGKKHRYLVHHIDGVLRNLLGDIEWSVFIQSTVESTTACPNLILSLSKDMVPTS